jgi:hypothetical protein
VFWTWFFDGKCVVDCGDFVVNAWSYFGVEKYATDSGFIFLDSRFGNGWVWAYSAGAEFVPVEVDVGEEEMAYIVLPP